MSTTTLAPRLATLDDIFVLIARVSALDITVEVLRMHPDVLTSMLEELQAKYSNPIPTWDGYLHKDLWGSSVIEDVGMPVYHIQAEAADKWDENAVVLYCTAESCNDCVVRKLMDE